MFEYLGDRVTEFLTYSDEGAKFLFGDVFMEHFFAFKVSECRDRNSRVER